MEKHYQIKINHGKGSMSYLYCDAGNNPQKAAEDKANADLKKRTDRDNQMRESGIGFPFYNYYSAPKTLTVSEYDKTKGCVKRGGEKFKLKLCYIKTTYRGGGSSKQEWYKAEQ